MKRKTLLLLLFVIFTTVAYSQVSGYKAVYESLEIFREGYLKRDTSLIDEWCERLMVDDIEIIGTYSIQPQGHEWFRGKERAKRVFMADWIAWGELVADIEKSAVSVYGDFAIISFPATIKRSPVNSRSRTYEESAASMASRISGMVVDSTYKTNKNRLLDIAYNSLLVLSQYEKGEEFVWPLRITGAMVKEGDSWKFVQLHFSHPNRGFPNVRILER